MQVVTASLPFSLAGKVGIRRVMKEIKAEK
jgi:hypothetical protein